MIDWSKVSDNDEVINLIKQIDELEKKVRAIDEKALLNWRMEELNQPEENE
jgi:hypothetical protein